MSISARRAQPTPKEMQASSVQPEDLTLVSVALGFNDFAESRESILPGLRQRATRISMGGLARQPFHRDFLFASANKQLCAASRNANICRLEPERSALLARLVSNVHAFERDWCAAMLTGILAPIVTPLNKETLVMRNKFRHGLIVGLLTLMAAPAYSAVITQWAFENPPNPIAVNNSPAPSTGAGTASSIGMDVYPTPNIGVTTDDVLNGVAGDTGGNGNANLTQIWRVRAQAGAAGAANGWSSMAPIGTQGAVFAASTVGYNVDQRQLRLVRDQPGRGQSPTEIHKRRHHFYQRADHPERVRRRSGRFGQRSFAQHGDRDRMSI